MTETIAEHTVTNKFCASCWGAEFELIQAHDIAGNFTGLLVVCVHCREDTIGYVSDQYILRARSEDYIHYRRDAQAICKALGLQAPEFRTQAENLKALGF